MDKDVYAEYVRHRLTLHTSVSPDTVRCRNSTSFMASIPSIVARNHHQPTAQGKPAFSLSGAQQKVGGASSQNTDWGTIPHVASFPPPRTLDIARYPYAPAASGKGSFLSINEKKKDKNTDTVTGAELELPTFLSYVSPLSRYGGEPRRSKIDVKVEVIEVKVTDSPSSSARAPDTTL